MIKELVEEEAAALNDLQTFLKSKEPEIITAKSFQKQEDCLNVFLELERKSSSALKECQLIESLDRQLRLATESQEILVQLKELNELNDKILNCKNLDELVPLVLEWRKKQQDDSDIVSSLSESNAKTAEFVNLGLPEMIDGEIERILEGWTDSFEARDQESLKILAPYLRADSNNPLQPLFAAFPLTKLKSLLEVHRRLGNLLRVQKTFPDRLLNRFYAILSSKTSTEKDAAFSVGQIEELVPEKMKFATRISCILEATSYFIKLVDEDRLVPNFGDILMSKCGQIVRQIRKTAKESRGGYSVASKSNANVAVIDAQLNEICLIMATISDFIQAHPQSDALKVELDKWTAIHDHLEEAYLVKGIQRAIEMDQIVTSESSVDFPVSSCVDDIFYVLQASKTRLKQISGDFSLLPRILDEFFLKVLRRHLEMTVQALKPLNLVALSSETSFKPSRDLISTLVLVNNLVATRSNWASFSSEDFQDTAVLAKCFQNLFNYALQDGLYYKLLQNSIKTELQLIGSNGEALFIKIHSLLQLIHNLFKSTLAKEALNELLNLSVGEFTKSFCKQVLFDDRSTTDSTAALRYDRLLHELSQWLEDAVNMSNTSALQRLKQAIALLLVDSRTEGQELVDEWKRENSCQLRAGEILLIMNKKK